MSYHNAATGSKPLCLSRASGDGSRPRKDTNTSSGDFPPPSARTVSLNRLPVSSIA
jgi:hypothetical protein